MCTGPGSARAGSLFDQTVIEAGADGDIIEHGKMLHIFIQSYSTRVGAKFPTGIPASILPLVDHRIDLP